MTDGKKPDIAHAGHLWIPAHMKRAREFTKTRFWIDPWKKIRVAAPLPFPCPNGWQDIVCENAADADSWSARMRQQEKDDLEKSDEQRELEEGPVRDALRKELLTCLMNSKSAINRAFASRALDKLDAHEAEKKKRKFETYMHQEAAELGH
jgi:hypothetical protein